MNKSSAGKSALESAARVIADKGQLDRVENDSPKLKKVIREKLTLKLLDTLTNEMNQVVNKYIKKHQLTGSDGHFFTSDFIDRKVYDELLILKQIQCDKNIVAINRGVV
ncbi:hypothetical protein HQQ94_15395 [Shewanella sp. VB17]|uniref:hypothetical protein n=1 Tax=Shewanella sp. VB17 TaxID=2739432 RepID=UPI0015634DCD|nr:hypothetical protein [Shewanella sp. VB17]NRD74597.1 hypothetical protein [Shewanella sp. VB17]